jgi:hypothetical protein
MSVVTLRAHFDGKHICLDEPTDLPVNTQFLITVWPPVDQHLEEERAAWFAFAHRAFDSAYGPDEPDYSHCLGKPPPAE